MTQPDQLLCFQKAEGETNIVRGDKHPMLRDWRSGINLSELFAAGVLG
jgi:hypothetical protein